MTFFLRGIMGPFAHPLFTSATGIGIGIAVTTRRPAVRVLAPILGYLAAVIMHGIWNGSTVLGRRRVLLRLRGDHAPAAGRRAWRWRSGPGRARARCSNAALQQIVAMGWIRPEEIRWVARLSDRMSARAYAKRLGGKPAGRALRAYQQTLIEIAFLHNRASTGTPPRDVNQRMTALLQHAAALRPYVILPPSRRSRRAMPRPLPPHRRPASVRRRS